MFVWPILKHHQSDTSQMSCIFRNNHPASCIHTIGTLSTLKQVWLDEIKYVPPWHEGYFLSFTLEFYHIMLSCLNLKPRHDTWTFYHNIFSPISKYTLYPEQNSGYPLWCRSFILRQCTFSFCYSFSFSLSLLFSLPKDLFYLSLFFSFLPHFPPFLVTFFVFLRLWLFLFVSTRSFHIFPFTHVTHTFFLSSFSKFKMYLLPPFFTLSFLISFCLLSLSLFLSCISLNQKQLSAVETHTHISYRVQAFFLEVFDVTDAVNYLFAVGYIENEAMSHSLNLVLRTP